MVLAELDQQVPARLELNAKTSEGRATAWARDCSRLSCPHCWAPWCQESKKKKGDPDGLQGLQRTRGAMCSENQNPLENALSLEGGENVKASLNLKSKCQEECYISLHAWGASISFHSLSFHFLLVEGRQRHLPEPSGCREGV